MTLELLPFQRAGVEHLAGDWHRCLADAMGLGKTVQAIGAMNRLRTKTALVICPAQVRLQWAREIYKWSAINRSVFVVRDGKSEIPSGASIVVASYNALYSDKIYNQLRARAEQGKFEVFILDEAHYLKTRDAKRTKKILGRGTFVNKIPRKWLLTGTPITNRPIEFWPMLSTFAPDVIHPHLSYEAFGMYFCDGHHQPVCADCSQKMRRGEQFCPRCGKKEIVYIGFNYQGCSNGDELAERLKKFMLRREVEDVLSELPALVETTVELDVQSSVDLDSEHIATARRLLALEKIPEAAKYIDNLLSQTSKVVVFAYHRDVIEGIVAALEHRSPVVFYGGMSAEAKQGSIDNFISRPEISVIAIQINAGGTGVDGLQGVCNNAVFVELDWSPGVMAQAAKRLHRYGQKDTVFAHYLAVADSLDTIMAGVLKYKQSMIDKVVKAQEFINMSIEALLERIAVALEAQVPGGATDAKAPARAPRAGAAKKPEAAPPPADPPVNQAGPAPAQVDDDQAREPVRLAASEFISGAPPERQEEARTIIKTVIWPSLGCTALVDLPPAKFDAAIAEFKKGFAAFAPADTTSNLGDI